MKIALIQGSTQIEKNEMLYQTLKNVVEPLGHEVINFGVKADELETYSYTEVALLISMLLSSEVVDFVVTGCSSGQGMNMACNALPNVLCGFVQNPQDAFLFGRINDGNAVSLSLGLGYGWLGELNVQYIIEKLFDGDFGIGYPADVATRKVKETARVKTFNTISKRSIVEVLSELDEKIVQHVFTKKDVIQHVLANTTDEELIRFIQMKKCN